MKLDYGTQISPTPIKLSIGSIRKPTLREIAELSFERFSFYEMLLKLTPEFYFENMHFIDGDSATSEPQPADQSDSSLFHIIVQNQKLTSLFVEIFDYFFVEKIVFQEGYFIVLRDDAEYDGEITKENIQYAISENSFQEIVEIIQQVCVIYEEKEAPPKFKNELAKKLYEKMKKAKKSKPKATDKNLSLPNIISALCNKHPSLNYLNIWDLTVYQLIDAFNRTQINSVYDIESTRVSVWGDEKKTFDASLWYKNNYDTT